MQIHIHIRVIVDLYEGLSGLVAVVLYGISVKVKVDAFSRAVLKQRGVCSGL